jgi:hemolysin activation/secretion protein
MFVLTLPAFHFGAPGAFAQDSGNIEDRLLTAKEAARRTDETVSYPDRPALREGVVLASAQSSGLEQRLPETEDRRGDKQDSVALPPPPPLRDDVTGMFILTGVEISGSTIFPRAEFAPLYDGFLARTITIRDVSTITDAITEMYRKKGYFLSRAVAPAQTGSNGVLKITVAEGYIAHVAVKGDPSPEMRRRLKKLTAERPLRLATLERALALAGDLNGVKVVSSSIAPDPADLAPHLLTVEIKTDPFEASLYTDNRGVPAAGPIQTYARVAANSILKTGDQLSGGVFATPESPDELILGEIAYQAPLTRAGTYATLSAMVSHFDAGADLAALDTENHTRRASLTISHPVIRQRKMSLWADAGFEARDVEEERLGAPAYEDKLRIAFAGANFQKDFWNGTSAVSGRVSRGMNVLGASMDGNSLSRPDADGVFTKFTGHVSRYQNIGKTFGLYMAASAQASDGPLLASEEFSLGGARYGRAYDYGEITGDDGVATQIELRYGRDPDIAVLDFFQFYGFYDYGVVWNDNALPGFDSLTLESAGGGLRLTLPQSIYATFEIARPLNRTPITQDDRDWRGFFSISKRF